MTKFNSAIRIPRSAFPWLLFAAAVVFVYFFGLTIPLLGPDEPRYSQVAREMFERGDWVTPTLGGYHWFEKPALLYWLQIAAYNVIGVNEFAARFGSALFGLGTIISLWVLGRSLATEDTEKVREQETIDQIDSASSVADSFANWLALIAASSIGIIVFSRGASFDIILTFPMTAALVGFYIFDSRVQSPAAASGSDKSGTPPYEGGVAAVAADEVVLSAASALPPPQAGGPDKAEENHPPAEAAGPLLRKEGSLRLYIPLFAFYFFIGVAVLAKGLVGIVFPFAIVAFYYLLSWRFPSRTFLVSLIWGTAVSVLVAATWYFPMYLRHGWEFIDEFFIQHHFQRYTSNKYFHPQPFYFFLWVLPLMTIPWLPFFIAGIWDFGKKIFHRRDAEAQREKIENGKLRMESKECPLFRFSIAWLLVPLVFFSFSGSKLPGYILPAVPPALIITAVYVYHFVRKGEMRARLVQAIAVTTFVVIVGLLIFVVPQFADADSVKGLIAEANEKGYRTGNVLTLHQISHNAEFYAAGRLLRDSAGRQKRLYGEAEVLAEINKNDGKPVLLLVPLEYLARLQGSSLLRSEVLKDNGETAIVYVQAG